MYKDYLQPKRIGTFLQLAIVDILQSKSTKHIHTMFSHLKKLLTTNNSNLDLHLISKFFGLNDFKNVELLKPYELNSAKLSQESFQACSDGLQKELVSGETKFDEKHAETIFLNPSPCSNLTLNPKCEGYCNWHQKVVNNWPTSKIYALQG